MMQPITLCPETPQHRDFLYSLYASTRENEMALVNWTEAQKQAFLQMQFAAQHKSYTENYPGALLQMILWDGAPAGRLYVMRRAKGIHIIDIALLPAFRNRGIGTSLLQQILVEGAEKGLPVTIHVERFNPALNLYTRLGFHPIEDKGVYLLMEWTPHA